MKIILFFFALLCTISGLSQNKLENESLNDRIIDGWDGKKKILRIKRGDVENLGEKLFHLDPVHVFNADNIKLKVLPSSIGELKDLEYLDLRLNKLTSIVSFP